jgi:DNA polymerase V
METVDAINKKLGSNTIRPASTGAEHPWKMKQEKRSNCYTTRWKELLTIEERPRAKDERPTTKSR